MRGNLFPFWHCRSLTGSIPAHAGKPQRVYLSRFATRVYPRACGETSEFVQAAFARAGLSPRMRGNRVITRASVQKFGSIPAHAGKPAATVGRCLAPWVYPRACGETRRYGGTRLWLPGLSPRMRGNRGQPPHAPLHRGSIPAHAGKPRAVSAGAERLWVYPRACGETPAIERAHQRDGGLSPRMRGNPAADRPE